MVAGLIPPQISSLVRYLDTLTQRATIEDLKKHLLALDVTLDDLSDFCRFDEHNYRRNLICEGPFYQMLLICWKSGQRSPIHNHARSTCGLKVMAGTATETIFDHSPCGQVKAVRSEDYHAGRVTASQDGDTHQVSNLLPERNDLVTLHIYSPPLRSMDMFSITDNTVGTFRPTVFAYEDGGGI